MGDYVYSKQIDNHTSLDIFKENEKEFRPIVTYDGGQDNLSMGFSRRRSYSTQQEALEFFINNENLLIEEAIEDSKE